MNDNIAQCLLDVTHTKLTGNGHFSGFYCFFLQSVGRSFTSWTNQQPLDV